MMPTKLSIIILSYNTRERLKKCLESLRRMKSGEGNVEIIVVDNGSTDGSVEKIKNQISKIKTTNQKLNLKLIQNKENLGFAKGNNIGIKQAKGKYILLLNSDTVVEKNTISKMLAFMEKNPKAGVATCRVELADGRLDPACHRGFPIPWASLTYFLWLEKLFPKSRIFGRYHLGFLPMDKPHGIDSPSGAFYLTRKEVIDKVGLLDEDYFLYGEDLDWSYRIKQAGFKILYNPEVKITHFKKQSGRSGEDPKLRKETTGYFYETMKIFYKKHYLDRYPWFITAFVMLAIEIKKQLSLIKL